MARILSRTEAVNFMYLLPVGEKARLRGLRAAG